MPIKNNDDVAHLLDATGRVGAVYQEFDTSSDHLSAPLIDAVFAQAPPRPAPEERLALPASVRADLLSEVFDQPAREAAAPAAMAAVPASGDTADRGRAPGPEASVADAPKKRSLADIRRVITRPSEQAMEPPRPDSLNGLFDRLAG